MRRVGDIARGALVALVLAALAGCGGKASAPQTAAATGGSPQEIIAATEAALGRVQSFHLEGEITDSEGESAVEADVVLPGRVRLGLRLGDRSADVIVIGPDAFIRANRAFYEALGGSSARIAPLVAGKWIRSSTADSGFDEFLAIADPQLIGHCMMSTHLGTLSKAGTDDVDGHTVTVIEDAGNVPGGAPGRAYIQADGEPLPLRLTQTGPRKPGGTPDARCKETPSEDDASASDIRLSRWNEDVSIEAPTDVLDPSQLGAPGGTTI